LKILNY